MATKKSNSVERSDANSEKNRKRIASLFSGAKLTDESFSAVSWAMMHELAVGNMSAAVGNAISSNARNLLKLAELKYKYGHRRPPKDGDVLELRAPRQAKTVYQP